MAVKIYHGDILFTPEANHLEIHENSYIIVEDGVVSQICGNQHNTFSCISLADQLLTDKFGSSDVQSAGGLACHDHLGVVI